MANFLFKSRYQKRYENGKLIAVSRAEYNFQNIPAGPGNVESLDNIVIQIYIERIVSFDVIRQRIVKDMYYFKDRSNCIDVIYTFDQDKKEIKAISFDRADIKAKIIFLESENGEKVPEELLVEDVSSREEMCNVYPERTYSDDKLEDEIDTYQNRIETAQEYLEDEDDPTVRGVLASRLSSYRGTLRQLLLEKHRRNI